MRRVGIAILSGLALALNPVAGQSPQPAMPLTRLTGRIDIDGKPDEAAWRAITPLPLTQYTPTFKGRPTQRTEIRVGYDDENFYAAGWFYDSDPSGIRVNSLYRDRWNGDDAFAIYIDTFNDNQTSKWFGFTAGGMRFDVLVSNDGATTNGSWDTFWTAKSTVSDSGWFAEVKIPFSSLGFTTNAEGDVVMGLTVTRLVSRLDERVTFPAIDPRFEFRRPSVAQDVILRGVHSRKPVYITPYALTGAKARLATSPTTGISTVNTSSNDAGLDLRYPLSPRLTLDLTANTDFAQVEVDDQQVNLDRFPLFFPERRRFFQEGSGNFDFPMGATQLFHSRRIGLSPSLEPVPVVGGARLVGRGGPWDVGFLEMQTRSQGTAPSENFGVLRMRRPVFNSASTAGFAATTYIGGPRTSETLAADTYLRVAPDHFLGVKLATVLDNTDTIASDDRLLRSAVDMRFERRVQRGLAYSASLFRAERGYRPELGFMPRRDFTTNNYLANWYFFTDRSRIFRRVYPGALAFSTYRNADRKLESGQYAIWVQWDTKAGGGGWVEPKYFHEDVLAAFPIGKSITIPSGGYDFADLQVALMMKQGARIRTSADLRAGTYFDGRRAQAILTPTWNVSPHLELGSDYQITALRFDSRNQSENIQVGRLRVRVAADARLSASLVTQYATTTDRLDFNARVRYAFAEGTDLWLVYNEGLDTERGLDPISGRSPLSLGRTLIMKYTHTLTLDVGR
jgi:hypothetical protein